MPAVTYLKIDNVFVNLNVVEGHSTVQHDFFFFTYFVRLQSDDLKLSV